MQTVSLETAQRLKAAGLEQGIHYGDYYAMTKITEVSDAQPFSLPILAKSTEQIEWLEAHRDSYVRLPRLGDVMDEIRRRVEVAEIIFGDGHCTVLELKDPDDKSRCLPSWEGEGSTDTENAGRALIKIMEAQNDATDS